MRLDVIEQARAIREATQRAARYMPDDVAAVQPKALYDTWAAGMHYEQGTLLVYGEQLYRVVTAGGVDSLAHQPPGAEGMTAVYAPVNVTNAGTAEDPVPAVRGMEYEYGKYYLDPEDGRIYLCSRSGETGVVTLQYLPHELVGHYFVLVD